MSKNSWISDNNFFEYFALFLSWRDSFTRNQISIFKSFPFQISRIRFYLFFFFKIGSIVFLIELHNENWIISSLQQIIKVVVLDESVFNIFLLTLIKFLFFSLFFDTKPRTVFMFGNVVLPKATRDSSSYENSNFLITWNWTFHLPRH